jgi:hypothetical protein
MKILSFLLLALLPFPIPVLGQGHVAFNNTSPDLEPITIASAPGAFNSTNGPAGAYLGSDYTASLYYLNATITDKTMFDSMNPILFASADTLFGGATGLPPNHDPNIDGAGLFDNSDVFLYNATTIYVTVQVRAWYNDGGAYTSYDQALAAGQNVGESNPVPIQLAVGLAAPAALDGLLPFTVGVPEPSSNSLIGFGTLVLWLVRRWNKFVGRDRQ